MKRFASILFLVTLAACASAQQLPPTDQPAAAPTDILGRLRERLLADPNLKSFVLSDLNNALDQAKAAGEIDGMSCLPTLIGCVNGDATICGEPSKVTGFFSLKEAHILGTPIRTFLIPKKLHHDCAAWFADSNLVGSALQNALPLK